MATLPCAFAALLLMLEGMANAAAWPEPQGHAQIIFSASWFQSTSQYGSKGQISPYAANGLFNQYQVMPYMDVGLTSKTSLSLNPSLSHLLYKDKFGHASGGGFGDIEFSIRHQLASFESGWLLSGQGTWKFPAYSVTRDPAPGNHQQDFEGRFLAGRGGMLGRKPVFLDTGVGYRYRAGAPADQVRADVTAGIDVFRRATLMAQFFGIKGMRNGSPVRPNSNPNAQSDFDLYKGQGSVVFHVTDATALQLGWGNTIAGRNTGKGSTIVLALWRSF
jgi:hypothetical protein